MTPDRESLEGMSREALIGLARETGVKRADVLTRMELCDEILRASVKNPVERRRARGWLGVARDLLASVVEQGLNLPEAAAMIRGEHSFAAEPRDVAPIATVTLAEIYSAQGHPDRALQILDEVLSKEPDHAVAQRLRVDLNAARARAEAARSGSLAAAASPPAPSESAPEAAVPVAGEPKAPESKAREPSGPQRSEPSRLDPPDAAVAEAAAPDTAEMEVPVEFPSDDVLVTLRTGPRQLYVYWERRDADVLGAPRIQLVSTEPSAGSVARAEQFLDATPSVGGRYVSVSSKHTIVRAALLLDDRGRARARAVAVDGRLGESGVELVWSPRRRLAAASMLDRAAAHCRNSAS
jgi:hypothetical protein